MKNWDWTLIVLYVLLTMMAVGAVWAAYESHIANEGVAAMVHAIDCGDGRSL